MIKSLKDSLVQVLLIVFSVVLGLYLSERIEERKNKLASNKILENIKSELRENKAQMDEWIPYHVEMIEKFDRIKKDPIFIKKFSQNNELLMQELFTKGTFLRVFPSSDAWEIAKSNPLVTNIDFDHLLILSKIHNQQQLTYQNFDEMFKPYFNEHDPQKKLDLLYSNINEVVGREQLLLYYYEQAEEILNL